MPGCLTLMEWTLEAEARFGPDENRWKFVCPRCGRIQTTADFEPYRAQGAESSSVYLECLGRYEDPRCDYEAETGGPYRIEVPETDETVAVLGFYRAEAS